MTNVTTSTVVRALVVGAVVAGTAGFVHAGKTVTVTVDGQAREVRTYSDTVAQVLDAQGVPVGEHDSVVPALGDPVGDGTTIVVRRGRPVTLTVDGVRHQIWTTAETVDELTATLGARYAAAVLTASRSQRIPMTGLAVGLSLPKHVTVVHDGTVTRLVTTETTVSAALERAGIVLLGADLSRPALDQATTEGMRIRVVRVTERRTVVRTRIAYQVRSRDDSSLYRGQVKVLAAGRVGIRTTTYVITRHDGKVVSRTKVSTHLVRAPHDRVVAQGTKTRPSTTSRSGGGVDSLNWGALARCESGGNPRAVGGGGIYFGLYQFTLGTWHGVGGVGNPIDASPAEQTHRAKLLYGNRGSQPWPVCGRMLYT